jgi:cellulose synthase/poly-beta-1,6-N-acetylglucosamine synthase-like glycosyltransferase
VGSAHYLGYARRAWRPRAVVPEAGLPGVTLIVPCCGDEDGLEANLEALLGLHYPRFQVRLVVANSDDAAVPVIERVRARHPGRSELIVAGPGRDHGQKIHNLLAALDAGPQADVLAFADSDGRPEPGWLRRLVAGLGEPGVGVTSSYRFYRPKPPGFATLLRSVWNLSVSTALSTAWTASRLCGGARAVSAFT